MKYLKIDSNKGYFLNPNSGDESEWIEIDKIEKDHLLGLMNKAIQDDFIMDEFSEDQLKNKAHQIIYRNIYTKFLELFANKSRFKDDSEKVYLEALNRYKEEIDT